MPRKSAKTHRIFRSQVCLVCAKKGSSPRNITGKLLEQVHKYWIENYDPTNPKLPSSLCSRCRHLFYEIDKGTKTIEDLPELFDFSQLKFPKHTRSTSNLDDLTHCQCDLCLIGSQKGNAVPYPMGRPKHSGPDQLPMRRPITICERCLSRMEKGKEHPINCGISDRRENMQDLLESGMFTNLILVM